MTTDNHILENYRISSLKFNIYELNQKLADVTEACLAAQGFYNEILGTSIDISKSENKEESFVRERYINIAASIENKLRTTRNQFSDCLTNIQDKINKCENDRFSQYHYEELAKIKQNLTFIESESEIQLNRSLSNEASIKRIHNCIKYIS